jgi:hypothetical protein
VEPSNFEATLIWSSNIAIVFFMITSFWLSAKILMKVKANHLTYKNARTLLFSLGIFFLMSGLTGVNTLIHQIVHTIDKDVHLWFAIGYIIQAIAILFFAFMLGIGNNASFTIKRDKRIGER